MQIHQLCWRWWRLILTHFRTRLLTMSIFALQSEGQSKGKGLLLPTEFRNQRKRVSSAWWVQKSTFLLHHIYGHLNSCELKCTQMWLKLKMWLGGSENWCRLEDWTKAAPKEKELGISLHHCGNETEVIGSLEWTQAVWPLRAYRDRVWL